MIEVTAKMEAHVLQTPQAYCRDLLQSAIRVGEEERHFKITTPWNWEMTHALAARISLDQREVV